MGKHLIVVLDDAGLSAIAATAASIDHPDPPITPVMDARAAAGVNFLRNRVSPRCSPTRNQIFSGQYAFRSGVGDNVVPTHTIPVGTQPWLAEIFDATHECGLFGKWHLGTNDGGFLSSPLKPGSGGVGYFDTHQGAFSNFLGPDDFFYWVKLTDGVTSQVGAGDGPGNQEPANYATTVNVDDAAAWINARAGDWIAVVAFNAPHIPQHVPPASLLSAPSQVLRQALIDLAALDLRLFDQPAALSELVGEPGRFTSIADVQWQPIRLALEAIDTEVGRLLAATGVDLATDTTLWIVGDNGHPSFVITGREDPDHGKNTMFDTSIRCPLIVDGAAVSASGECLQLVDAVDYLPTIASIESVTLPGGDTFDGFDFSPCLANVSASSGRVYSLSETINPPQPGGVDFQALDQLGDYANTAHAFERAFTSATHKLVRFYDLNTGLVRRSALYDLERDPFERVNLLPEGVETFDGCRGDCRHFEAMVKLQQHAAAFWESL